RLQVEEGRQRRLDRLGAGEMLLAAEQEIPAGGAEDEQQHRPAADHQPTLHPALCRLVLVESELDALVDVGHFTKSRITSIMITASCRPAAAGRRSRPGRGARPPPSRAMRPS